VIFCFNISVNDAGKPFMYMKNKIGPNAIPWGTTDVIGTVLGRIPFTTTVCGRSDRKAWNQSRVFLVYHSIGVDTESEGGLPYQMIYYSII
jgi:hypothetical protein